MRCLARNRPWQLMTAGEMFHTPRSGEAASGVNWIVPLITQAAPPVAPAGGTDPARGRTSRIARTARRRITTPLGKEEPRVGDFGVAQQQHLGHEGRPGDRL